MIQHSLEDGVMRLTLSRPVLRNTIDTATAEALTALLRDENPEIRCFLIDAQGPVFCNGADGELTHSFDFRLWIRKPVVCAVQGAVLGPGVAIAANAHVVVAAQGTSFGLTEVRTGGWPAGLPAIQRAIGERRAVELALSGRVFGAPEALQMGLVHELAPAFEFDDRAEAIALHLASLKLDGRLPVTT